MHICEAGCDGLRFAPTDAIRKGNTGVAGLTAIWRCL